MIFEEMNEALPRKRKVRSRIVKPGAPARVTGRRKKQDVQKIRATG